MGLLVGVIVPLLVLLLLVMRGIVCVLSRLMGVLGGGVVVLRHPRSELRGVLVLGLVAVGVCVLYTMLI